MCFDNERYLALKITCVIITGVSRRAASLCERKRAAEITHVIITLVMITCVIESRITYVIENTCYVLDK